MTTFLFALLLIAVSSGYCKHIFGLSSPVQTCSQIRENSDFSFRNLKLRIINDSITQPLKSKSIYKIINLEGGSLSITNSLLSLSAYKLTLQLVLTIFNIICWSLPLQNKNFTQNTFLMGIANSFSGGIFLMMAFGHLIPHSVEAMGELGHSPQFSYYFTLAGYLLMLFIEKVAFSQTHALLHGSHESCADTHVHHAHSHHHHHSPNSTSSEKPTSLLSPKSAMVLVFAMSIHSFFETVALGLTNDKPSALMLAASIALHQPAESIALLLACLKTSLSMSSIIKLLSVYSIVGPLGVMSGVLISKVSSPLIEALVVAVTAGTFLYVGATEIANEEFEHVEGVEKYGKFVSLLSGMGFMAVVHSVSEKWEHLSGHSHSHS